MRRLRILGATLAALVIAHGGLAAAPAVADAPEPLFDGVLRKADGSPAPGQTVTMYLWPAEEQLAGMSEGDSFKLRAVGSVTTSADGTFRVPRPAGGSVPSVPGIYDVTLAARGDAGMAAIETSVRATSDGLSTIESLYPAAEEAMVSEFPPATLGARGRAAKIEASPGKAPFVTLTVSADPAQDPEAQDQVMTASGEAYSTTTSCASGSTTSLVQTYTNRLTAVGSIHATTNGHKSQFVLSSGSDASLGTAVKSGSGSWSVGVSVSRTLQSETRWAARTASGHTILQTRYKVGRYKTVIGDMGTCSTYYTMKAMSHEGGAESSTASNPTANYCRNYEKDSGITLTRNSATKWTNGLSLSSIIGIDVNSSAGYSSSEKIIVDISATGRKICGTNKYPGEYPSRVVVKPR